MSTPSVAAQIIVSIIPIVGIVMGCIVIFFYIMWDHKLKVYLIENNLYEKKRFDIDTFSLLTGLILFILGLSLLMFFLIRSGFSYGFLSGLIPASLGLSMLLFVFIRNITKIGK